jgi:hypothetical protein
MKTEAILPEIYRCVKAVNCLVNLIDKTAVNSL